jgi:hypothetical protein
MENNHKLALYVSYYLSRFNDEALKNLGYSSWNEAFDVIGDKLKVKKLSIRNWRDEFDPLFGHRAGWYQRPMSPSRIKVVQALEDLDEQAIRAIVEDILADTFQNNEEEKEQLLNIIVDDDKRKTDSKFIVRGPTGRLAEEYFINYFKVAKMPGDGDLIDCRDLGVGYDFRIENADKKTFVEVKGLAEISGGVLFTNKEWTVAQSEGDNYFICVVSNLSEKVEINFIQNPAEKLNPKKNIYTTIQISWSVTQNQLAELYEGK